MSSCGQFLVLLCSERLSLLLLLLVIGFILLLYLPGKNDAHTISNYKFCTMLTSIHQERDEYSPFAL